MSEVLTKKYIHPDFGDFFISANEQYITKVILPGAGVFEGAIGVNSLLVRAVIQLDEYFLGNRKIFDLPLWLTGSPFELLVWQTLQQIPYGSTASYGEIAKKIGKTGAARAVGRACHRNLLPIFIPCHRVICSDGRIGGFATELRLKKQLLDLEK